MSEIDDLREEHLLGEIARLRAEIATIRADEAAKVRAATIEECVELVDFPSDATATTEPSDYVKGRRDAAQALRTKLGAEHG
jgi:hypothetical protein